MAEEEIWKALSGVPGIEVSTFGNVRTLDKVVSTEKRTQFVKGRVLKQHDNTNGYLIVRFRTNGERVTKLMHRLVAQTFIPNPDNLPQVNHKNCDRRDNRINNLEWCTSSYNNQYREKFGEAQGHPVFAINLATLEVYQYPSQMEASRSLGISVGNINSVISGRYKQTDGYWFVNDDGHAVDVVKSKLHDVGETGLKIKHRATSKMH